MKKFITLMTLLSFTHISAKMHLEYETAQNNNQEFFIQQEETIENFNDETVTKPSLTKTMKQYLMKYSDVIIVFTILGIITYGSIRISQNKSKTPQQPQCNRSPLWSEIHSKRKPPQTAQEAASLQLEIQQNYFWSKLKRGLHFGR